MNKEQHREYMKVYRKKYKQRICENSKQYHLQNRQKHNEWSRLYYQNNKEKFIVYRMPYWKAIYSIIEQYRTVCSRCGMDEKVCLDFHHRDPKTKKYTIGSRLSVKTLLIELAKCDILCANCHRKEHATIVEA